MKSENTRLIILIVLLAFVVGLLGGYIINNVLSSNDEINDKNCINNNQDDNDKSNNNQNNNDANKLTDKKIYDDMVILMDELIAQEISPGIRQKYYDENYVDSEYGRSKIVWSIVAADNTINTDRDLEATGDLSVSLDDYSRIYSKVIGYEPDINNNLYSDSDSQITISNNKVYGFYVTGRYNYELKFNSLVNNDDIYILTIDYLSYDDEGDLKRDSEIEIKFEIETDNNYKISSLIIR